MRLLVVTNDYPPRPGGIQQYVGNLVARYAGEVRVLAPYDSEARPDAQVERSDRPFMWPTTPTRRWVEAQVDAFEPDVVAFGAPHPLAMLGPALMKRTGIPYVVMTHGAEAIIPLQFPVLRRLVLRALRGASTVFSVSEYTNRIVTHATGRPVITLGAGVDTDLFSPAEAAPERYVIGCVGRFVPRKGHARVVRAAATLRDRGHDVEVLMVGTGRLERGLREGAERLAVPTRFEVDVAWDRLPDLYRQMSVFAMPARSRWFGMEAEGLGIVYLEAAASGLPVIAGSSGGAPETVIEGETGFVADSTDRLAEAIERLLLDPGRASRMGAAGRSMVLERFTWDAVLERFVAGLSGGAGAESP